MSQTYYIISWRAEISFSAQPQFKKRKELSHPNQNKEVNQSNKKKMRDCVIINPISKNAEL